MQAPDRQVLRRAWRLARPFWTSGEERWIARLLLAAVVALSLAQVWLAVRMNDWRGDFFDALQELDERRFFVELGVFAAIAFAWMIAFVYQQYLQQMLQFRWRRWMTERLVHAWLAERAWWRMQLDGDTDNPDQRLTEDVAQFAWRTLALGLGLLNAATTLVSFLVILWGLSGTVELAGFTIHGSMFWAALLYAAFGTWLARRVGLPLVQLGNEQQRLEADFRFSLVRVRENAESIAFLGGEAREEAALGKRFAAIWRNWGEIMLRQKKLAWTTAGYGQVATVFPYLIAAPRFFAKEISLGALMQTASAFEQVHGALSFIVNSYGDIAAWTTVVNRLDGFAGRLEALRENPSTAPVAVREGAGVLVDDLDLDLPSGAPLQRGVRLAALPGAAVLVTGASGAGKSTLLRALAGLWPWTRGHIRLGVGVALFLPQRPYLPLGTLREALAYPGAETGPIQAAEALDRVGLAHLAPALDEAADWSHRLSLGEQQRLVFARILLLRPQAVFLDEATSALDEPAERALYALLRDAPWKPAVVSVGHRSTLRALHDRVVELRRSAGAAPMTEKTVSAVSFQSPNLAAPTLTIMPRPV